MRILVHVKIVKLPEFVYLIVVLVKLGGMLVSAYIYDSMVHSIEPGRRILGKFVRFWSILSVNFKLIGRYVCLV